MPSMPSWHRAESSEIVTAGVVGRRVSTDTGVTSEEVLLAPGGSEVATTKASTVTTAKTPAISVFAPGLGRPDQPPSIGDLDSCRRVRLHGCLLRCSRRGACVGAVGFRPERFSTPSRPATGAGQLTSHLAGAVEGMWNEVCDTPAGNMYVTAISTGAGVSFRARWTAWPPT